MSKLKSNKKNADKVLSDALSKISGISKKAIQEIWISVKENHKLLDSCSFHIFESINDPSMSKKFKCKNCSGVVGFVEKNWYEKGLTHDSPSHRYLRQFKDY